MMMMMIAQLAKSYSPAESESEVRGRWDQAGVFGVDPGEAGQPYCIVIPPPNVTAALHLGHAFDNTLQDVLIRYHRMRGFNTLWMPGTDHAGIATQTVVERRLLQQGRRRTDMQRDEFVAAVQAWKDEYEATIIEQLKAMGCSCDFDRLRFTMDPVCTAAVREAFFRLFADGLIYRGKRLVNWDPVTLTALADDEVEMQEVDGHMWYLRYPLERHGGTEARRHEGEEPEYVVVATTRPETMLGDTAVAVNPRDPRAEALVGRHVRLPIVNRLIPIVADDYVVLPDDPDNPMAEFATGFLKVTPAHDPNDWEIGQRHGLAVINIMAPDATISRDHGWPAEEFDSGQAREAQELLGLSRDEARRRVVDWFRRHDLLEDVRDYRHGVGHSYRSHVPIEPYLSDQWYVKVTDDAMRGEALRAMVPDQVEGAVGPRADGSSRRGDGELRIFPPRYARSYQAWHENLRDWCISRQLWWGHRIPVWVSPEGSEPSELHDEADAVAENEIASAVFGDRRYVCVRHADGHGIAAALERAGYEQDPDVLDTWFSSGLWPISTMGWPDPQAFPDTVGLLERFNPSSVLCTARDIITLWVSRMVMFNRYFRDGLVPYRHVYIHPMIQDGHGQRMSKSLGNGVDPRDIIHSHGADAMRFVLVHMATTTQDVRLPVDLVCPHCGRTFHPKEITSPAGYRVAAPQQQCRECGKASVSAYGAATGLAEPTADMPLARNSSGKFDLGRNFANKLWNATRFALGNLAGDPPGGAGSATDARDDGGLGLMDRWIIGRLAAAARAIDRAIGEYQFHDYAEAMYDLVWRDFCDWYLEAIKPTVRGSAAQQQVLRTVLNAILRMLHPICPFVTEALWPHVRAAGPAGLDAVTLGAPAHPDVIATAPWPRIDGGAREEAIAAQVDRLQALTTAIRNVRAEHNVPPKRRIRLLATPEIADLVASGQGVVETLAGLDGVRALDAAGDRGAGAGSMPLAFEGQQLAVEGVTEQVDPAAERARLAKIHQEKEKTVSGLRRRLANSSYVQKAPPHLVEETRTQLAAAEADLAAARRALDQLQG